MANVLYIEVMASKAHNRFSIVSSKVTAKAVEAKLEGIEIPVKITYRNSIPLYIHHGFDRNNFLKWWKRAKEAGN